MKHHLIQTNEVVVAGRPMGSNINDERLLAYITEVEMMSIKPVLGDKLYHQLLQDDIDEQLEKLLSGGTYVYNGDMFHFTGLKATISYYVFAKNVMVGDFQPTRYGIVLKESDYSTHISTAERSSCYNDTIEVANSYLQNCIDYCKRVGLISKGIGKSTSSGGIKIRKIG